MVVVFTICLVIQIFSSLNGGVGNSWNKYFEIYNPTNDTVHLSNYGFPSVSNSPSTQGVYEYWNDFDSSSVILPNDVFIVSHYFRLIPQYYNILIC